MRLKVFLALALLLPVLVFSQTVKISGLPPAATEPLTGNEIFPCDQGGTTSKCIIYPLRDTISLKDYSLSTAPSGVSIVNVSTTNGSGTVNNFGGHTFAVGVVGDIITIADVYGNNGNIYTGVITARASATQVTVSPTVGFTVSSGAAWWGPDQTTSFAAAWAAALAANKCLYVPAGNYFYNAAGLSGWQFPCVLGDTVNQTNIFIASGDYFIDDNEPWTSAELDHISYYGGTGAIRNRYSGSNVNFGPVNIHDNDFRAYTGAAVTLNSSDQTGLRIINDTFAGLSSINSIGVAIAGSDFGVIDGNNFGPNLIGIKMGAAGGASHIYNNDFGDYAEVTPGTYTRAAIMLVPSFGRNNTASYAEIISGNKFGPENLDVKDVRVLLADSATYNGTTTFFGDVGWKTTLSAGSISSLNFTNNNISSLAGYNPIFYSYTPYFYENRISAELNAIPPSYIVQFDAAVTPADDPQSTSNVFGPFTTIGFGYAGPSAPLISNIPSWGQLIDPNGDFYAADPTVMTPFLSGSGPGEFISYLNVPWVTQGPYLANITAANITDPNGGTDAVTLTTTGTTGYQAASYATIVTPQGGPPVWFDFWARKGSSGTSMTSTTVICSDSTFTNVLNQKGIALQTAWRHYKMPIILKQTASLALNCRFFASSSVASTTMDVALIRIYGASEPMSGGMFVNPIQAPAFESVGQTFTVAGSGGGCGTIGTKTGGPTAGKFVTAAVTACQVTITFGDAVKAPADTSCWATDDTTPTHLATSIASTSSTATINFSTVTAGDTIKFGCVGF